MILPFDTIPQVRPTVHLCTEDRPWHHRELKKGEEVCHPDAVLWSAHLGIFRCPHCKGHFKQEQPK